MSTTNFTTTFLVDRSREEVFNAINQVSDWWQGAIEGNTNMLNDEFTYKMKEHHYSKQKLVELIPYKKIVWLVTESKLNSFADKSEWTGTAITFEIETFNDQTQVKFTHVGLVPTIQCYGACSGAWEQLIQKSLFSLITTGRGTKVFG